MDRQIDWIGRQLDGWIDRWIGGQIDRHIDRQIDIDRWIDRQKARQTDFCIHIKAYAYSIIPEIIA